MRDIARHHGTCHSRMVSDAWYDPRGTTRHQDIPSSHIAVGRPDPKAAVCRAAFRTLTPPC